MADEVFRLGADDSEIIRSLDELEKRFASAQDQAKEFNKGLQDGLNKSSEDAAKLTSAIQQYQQQEADLAAKRAENAKKFAAQEAEAAKRHQDYLANLDREAQKTRMVAEEFIKKADATKKSQAATDSATNSGNKYGISIGGLIGKFAKYAGVVGTVVVASQKLQGVMDFVDKIMASVSATVNVLIDRLGKLGSSIVDFFSGNWSQAADEFSAAFDNIGGAIVDAAVGAFELEGRVQKLRDAELAAAVAIEKRAAASQKAQAIADDENRSFNERLSAINRAIALEAELGKTRASFAQQELQNAKDQFALSTKTADDRKALNDAEIASLNIINDAEQTRIQLLEKRSTIEKQRLEFIKKAVDFAFGVQQKIETQTPIDPLQLDLAKVNKDFDELIKQAQEGVAKLNAVEKERALTPEEIQLRQSLATSDVQIEEARQKALLDVLLQYAQKDLDAEKAQQKAKEALAKKDFDAAKKSIETLKDLNDQEIDIQEQSFKNLILQLKAHGDNKEKIDKKELEFDRQIKAKRLENELAFQQALLEIIDPSDKEQIEAIKKRIELLRKQIQGLNIPVPKKDKNQFSNIWDVFGVDDKDKQQAFQQVAQQIGSVLGQLTEAEKQRADAAVAAADKVVEAKQRELDEQIKLAERGKANDEDQARKALAAAQKARSEALKEQTRAARAQILLDSATQLSGLVTSSVNIYKALSPLGPFGIAGAIATIALMFGSFAKAKADALKAVGAPKLRKGAKIEGRTHEQGGELRELEKDEQVVGAREAKGNDRFYDNVRKGKYIGIDIADVLDRAKSPGGVLDGATERIVHIKSEQSAAQKPVDFEKAVNMAADRIIQAIVEKPEYAPWKSGYRKVSKRGNMTEIKTILPDS